MYLPHRNLNLRSARGYLIITSTQRLNILSPLPYNRTLLFVSHALIDRPCRRHVAGLCARFQVLDHRLVLQRSHGRPLERVLLQDQSYTANTASATASYPQKQIDPKTHTRQTQGPQEACPRSKSPRYSSCTHVEPLDATMQAKSVNSISNRSTKRQTSGISAFLGNQDGTKVVMHVRCDPRSVYW